jgi:hypothetical protein
MKHAYIVFSMIAFALFGCNNSHEVMVTATNEKSKLAFDFDYRNIGGLLKVKLWQCEPQVLIWELDLNYFVGPRLVYGETPLGFTTKNGALADANQVVPPLGTLLPPILEGHKFWLQIVYQYDAAFSANADVVYYLVEVGSGGSRVLLTPLASRPKGI